MAKAKAEQAEKMPAVSTYTVDEFASAPETLGVTSPDIIRAAFSVAGKDQATLDEAKKLVEKFKNKGVK